MLPPAGGWRAQVRMRGLVPRERATHLDGSGEGNRGVRPSGWEGGEAARGRGGGGEGGRGSSDLCNGASRGLVGWRGMGGHGWRGREGRGEGRGGGAAARVGRGAGAARPPCRAGGRPRGTGAPNTDGWVADNRSRCLVGKGARETTDENREPGHRVAGAAGSRPCGGVRTTTAGGRRGGFRATFVSRHVVVPTCDHALRDGH